MKLLLLAFPTLLFAWFGSSAPVTNPAPAAGEIRPAALVSGSWTVVGHDQIPWTAELVLLEEANAGYFDWESEHGDTGRELVTWAYDPATQTLRLTGHQVLGARGNITFGNYSARVVNKGRQLVDGAWWGPPCSKGVWTAER